MYHWLEDTTNENCIDRGHHPSKGETNENFRTCFASYIVDKPHHKQLSDALLSLSLINVRVHI